MTVRERPCHLRLVMYQRWEDLLFLHWSCDPSMIQQTLPDGLSADTFEGRAYLGVVPFFMRDVRPKSCPKVPGISDFLELNFRTYACDARGIPGVWFYSLDANQRLAVRLAKRFFRLPYFDADMRADRNSATGEVTYSSRRHGTDEKLTSRFRYRPHGEIRVPEPGTLEFFLIERYVLFAVDRTGTLFSGRVHHKPYRLMDADVAEWNDSLFELNGLPRPRRAPDHVLFSPGPDVEVFAIERD